MRAGCGSYHGVSPMLRKSSMQRSQRFQRGVTLIEVLVGVTVGLIILAGAVTVITNLSFSTNTTRSTEVPPSPEEEALLKKLEELLQQAQNGLQGFDQKYQNLQVNLDTPPEPIPTGDTFLSVMP